MRIEPDGTDGNMRLTDHEGNTLQVQRADIDDVVNALCSSQHKDFPDLSKAPKFRIESDGNPRSVKVLTPTGENITRWVRSVSWNLNAPDAQGKRRKIPVITLELVTGAVDVSGFLVELPPDTD